MQKIFVLLAIIHIALPVPLNKGKVIYDVDLENGKLTYESDLKDHSYSYRVETLDGTVKQESGHFEDDNLVVEGSYEYIDNKGLKHRVTYVADKNGYRPKASFGEVGKTTTAYLRSLDSTKTTASPVESDIRGSLLGGGAKRSI